MTSQKMKRATVAVLVCATIAGCASSSSVPRYAPMGEEKARLRIALSKGEVPRTAAGDGMTAFLHHTDDCTSPSVLGGVYTLDDGPAGHDKNRRNHNKAGELGMPLAEYDNLEVKEMLVDAGVEQDIALQFSVLLAGPIGAFTRCNIALEQEFEAGRDYEIVGRFDTINNCSAMVNELVAGESGVTRQPITRVNNADNPLSPACFVKY